MKKLKLAKYVGRVFCYVHSLAATLLITALDSKDYVPILLLFIYCLVVAIISGVISIECEYQIKERTIGEARRFKRKRF